MHDDGLHSPSLKQMIDALRLCVVKESAVHLASMACYILEVRKLIA